METNIKAPSPQVQTAPQEAAPKRTINRPSVGVVDVPKISTTPMKDTISLKKQENPKPKIELPKKKTVNLKLNGALSAIIGGCGIISLVSLIKRR